LLIIFLFLATKVGSSGISLSGGQKQRLALARAVYARKNIIMLDDVFSGLDADTEEHIFKSLFARKGLFRRLGTTVLISTHAVHRLPYADHIVAMKNDGSIAEQGTLKELEASGGYLTLLKTQYKDQANDELSFQQHGTTEAALDSSDQGNRVDVMEGELSR
jgi:ABC-type multidrug transport system fused ATPase/permease subunit